MLFMHLIGGALYARQAYHQLAAQPEKRIIRSGGIQGCYRQAGPARKLRRDQAAHQGYISMHFVIMHFVRSHRRTVNSLP